MFKGVKNMPKIEPADDLMVITKKGRYGIVGNSSKKLLGVFDTKSKQLYAVSSKEMEGYMKFIKILDSHTMDFNELVDELATVMNKTSVFSANEGSPVNVTLLESKEVHLDIENALSQFYYTRVEYPQKFYISGNKNVADAFIYIDYENPIDIKVNGRVDILSINNNIGGSTYKGNPRCKGIIDDAQIDSLTLECEEINLLIQDTEINYGDISSNSGRLKLKGISIGDCDPFNIDVGTSKLDIGSCSFADETHIGCMGKAVIKNTDFEVLYLDCIRDLDLTIEDSSADVLNIMVEDIDELDNNWNLSLDGLEGACDELEVVITISSCKGISTSKNIYKLLDLFEDYDSFVLKARGCSQDFLDELAERYDNLSIL